MSKFVISQKAGNYAIYDKMKYREVSDSDLSHHIRMKITSVSKKNPGQTTVVIQYYSLSRFF